MMPRTNSLRLSLALALAVAPAFGQAAEPPPDTAQAADAPAELSMLRLQNGAILWATIEDHGPQNLVLRRLDTGGLVNLPWDFLVPEQSHELRLRFGYEDVEGEEPMTDGHRILLNDGTELFGLVKPTTTSPDTLVLKQENGQLLVPTTRVKEVRPAQVAALEVYTKDEIYGTQVQALEKSGTASDPRAQYDLARFCERILAFPQALEHYKKARELDPNFKPSELAAILERVQAKVALQEQLDVLAEADRLKRKGYYQKALEVLARFDASYPDTPLRSDRLKLEDRVLKERARDVKRLVREQYYSWMDRLVANASREMPFESALDWTTDQLRDQIVKKVTEDARRIWPDVEEDQVRQMWVDRDPGRWRAASYGLGTWLLGEEAALKGSQPEAADKKPEAKTERDQQREDLEAKMKRFLKNQQMQRNATRSEDDEQKIANFWSTLTVATRKAWLIAYYAENGGDLEVRPKPDLSACPSCGGTGAREVLYTGDARSNSGSAGLRLERCTTCDGIGVIRRVRYR